MRHHKSTGRIELRVSGLTGTPIHTDPAGEPVATKAGLCLRREQLRELRALVDALILASGAEGPDGEGEGETAPNGGSDGRV